MKIFLSLLLTLGFIAPSFAMAARLKEKQSHGVERVDSAASVPVQKIYDGGFARCSERADVGYPAYRLELVSSHVVGESTTAKFKVNSLVCASSAQGFELKASNPITRLPNDLKILRNKIILIDADYNQVIEAPINPNSSSTEFTVTVESGRARNMEAFLRGLIESNNERYEQNGSAFRIQL